MTASQNLKTNPYTRYLIKVSDRNYNANNYNSFKLNPILRPQEHKSIQ